MNFLDWYRRYQSEITWWIIGWLSFAVLDGILKGSWMFVIINTGLIFLNYKIWQNR